MKFEFNSNNIGEIQVYFSYTENEKYLLSSPLQAFDSLNDGKISASLSASGFTGAASAVQVFHAPAKNINSLLVVGLGKLSEINNDTLERAAAIAIKNTISLGPKSIEFKLKGSEIDSDKNASALAFGAGMASYRFDKYKTKIKPQNTIKLETILIDADDNGLFIGLEQRLNGVSFARDLMNEPPNVLNPPEFSKRLVELQKLGVKVTVLGEKDMHDLGMFSFLGVGQGSEFPSQLVVMEYNNGGKEKPLALVGKGLCFDSGGISLKPAGGMEDMKGDMGGAAAVSGAMLAIAGRKAKANVVGLVGLSENMNDGNAQRPGDIVKSMSGQTIEVLNTDAEGRLVLCDVLTYAQRKFNPEYIIDLATLTGAIIISLGSEFAGLFSNSDDISEKITNSAKSVGEPVWRFPLSPAYDKLLDSNIADIKNVQRSGPGAGAGSITAAQFLQRFIEGETKWAHLDIAGTAWKTTDDPREPSWGTGYGVRLLDQLVADYFEL